MSPETTAVPGRPAGHRLGGPARGDLIAGFTVALVLIPQSLAYAELAGTPAVHGLYAAVVATLAAGLIGSSPYLQNGPTALTSLLAFGALAPLATVGTERFAALAALLALVVGAIRLVLGLFRWGVVAYLMSQPVVSSFTVAAAILIVASQVPALVDVDSPATNPLVAAGQALVRPGEWDLTSLAVGLATVALLVGGRRLSSAVPWALIAAVLALLAAEVGWIDVRTVGEIPSGLPPLSRDLPWNGIGALLLPGVVIAVVGFAEPASIARRYAAEDRTRWDPDREFIGQGLANVAAGMFSGYPSGGSFSRSALNRLSGARTRWSGAVTGLIVLAVMPFASALSGLPRTVLAGVVIGAGLSLIETAPFRDAWRLARLQFVVAAATFLATLLSAPRVERGVLVGVGLALAVHLWRELRLEVETSVEGGTLHVRPLGVLYFGSAPLFEPQLMEIVAERQDLSRVVVHLDGVGRLDLTGALVLRSLAEDMRRAGIDVTFEGIQPQTKRLMSVVFDQGRPS